MLGFHFRRKQRTAYVLQSVRPRSGMRRQRATTIRPEKESASPANLNQAVEAASSAVPYLRDGRFLATPAAVVIFFRRSRTYMRKGQRQDDTHASADACGEPLPLKPLPQTYRPERPICA